MEQQKVLWIIFSVALFVLVVVSISVVWFLPDEVGVAGRAEGQEASVVRGEREYNPVQWVRGSESIPAAEEGSPEDGISTSEDGIFIVYGESSDVSGDGSEETTNTAVAPQSVQTQEIIPASEPEIIVAPSESASSASDPASRVTTTTSKPMAVASVQKKPSTPKTIRITEYWIQAGSYQSKQRAEAARDSLKAKGVSSRITTKDVGSDTFYRVRIGPYPNKAEAAKFLDWVNDLSTFEGSYISQVYIQRTAN